MRQADLNTEATKLYKAHMELIQSWEMTKEYWKDETAEAFEENHLAPLSPMVKMLLDATNRLNEIFSRCERDLADPGGESMQIG